MAGGALAKRWDQRAQQMGAVLIVLVVAFLLGIGGYLIGKESGEDLGQARALGESVGEAHGLKVGHAAGFRTGFGHAKGIGMKQTYGRAFRRAYAAKFDQAGLETPRPAEIEVSRP